MEKRKNKEVTKSHLTIYLPIPLIERLKNAAYWTPGATIGGLIEETITKALDQMERERKAPFPQRKKLKVGRAMK